LNLRVRDLDVSNGQGWVRGGKGNKDRPFIIADGLKEVMAEAIDGMEQDDFLFSGKKGKMHPASFRAVLITAAKEAGLKHVHPHMLRHSFASHLAEQKYAATDIQVLLGHRNVETTMVYTHMVAMKLLRVRSPFDGK
jgi:site-specific recombinase XerD